MEKLSVHHHGLQHLPFDSSLFSKIPDIVKKIDLIWDKADVLEKNAAMALFERIEYLEPKDLYQIIRLNVQAPYILTQQLLLNLLKIKGYVINILSHLISPKEWFLEDIVVHIP